jgi:hypothetical protein
MSFDSAAEAARAFEAEMRRLHPPRHNGLPRDAAGEPSRRSPGKPVGDNLTREGAAQLGLKDGVPK